MSVVGTFNGWTIVSLPCDALTGVTKPSSIEWEPQEAVAVAASPFTGQTQIFDWQNSWWQGTVSFPPMSRYAADAWSAFILSCRGQANVFQIGDPKAKTPKGPATGTPLVHGSGQYGYSLVTRGWAANVAAILQVGDFIQIGYRLYKLTDQANSDGSGHATLSIWPNLRDVPPDGTAIATANCKGLFRLAANAGNNWSTNVGSFGVSGLKIREAI